MFRKNKSLVVFTVIMSMTTVMLSGCGSTATDTQAQTKSIEEIEQASVQVTEGEEYVTALSHIDNANGNMYADDGIARNETAQKTDTSTYETA